MSRKKRAIRRPPPEPEPELRDAEVEWKRLRDFQRRVEESAESKRELEEAYDLARQMKDMSIEEILELANGQSAEGGVLMPEATNLTPEEWEEVQRTMNLAAEELGSMTGLDFQANWTPAAAAKFLKDLRTWRANNMPGPVPAASQNGKLRDKADVLQGVTTANCFHVLLEIMLDIRDAIVPAAKEVSGQPATKRTKDADKWDTEKCQHILSYLNAHTGKRFKFVESNIRLVRGRLRDAVKQGYENPVELAELVIAMKVKQAKDGKFEREYLRPATLFNATKFWQYAADVPLDTPGEPTI